MADHKISILEGDAKSLAHQINTAITSSHTKINRLILDRMPKAVPPQADNPSKYITGLLHFGAAYIAFESLWQNIIGIHSEIAPIPYTYPFAGQANHDDKAPQVTERMRHILEVAYWPTMLRAARIKADIHTMTGWSAHVIDEQIKSVGTSGRLGKTLLHTQEAVNAKPHLLLAYAYCLYLALLSGGSYIRTELMYIGSDFWQATPSPVKPNMIECQKCRSPDESTRHDSSGTDNMVIGLASDSLPSKLPLEFLDFDPPLGDNPRQHTRELKTEFKRRFAEAARDLTEPERKDIVKEAVNIFQNMEGVITQLDKTCGSSQGQDRGSKLVQPQMLSPRSSGFGSRLRDSIAIAKGRLLRTRRRSSGSSITATVPIPFDEKSTDHSTNGSSKPSSFSSSSGESRDVDKSPSQESPLFRDAVVPGTGFRTIRYGNNLARPDRSPRARSGDAEKGAAAAHPHGFDGALADIESCPIFRSTNPTVATDVLKRDEAPNYALYAMISNFVVLFGVAMMFATYLYVRHGDRPPTNPDLGL